MHGMQQSIGPAVAGILPELDDPKVHVLLIETAAKILMLRVNGTRLGSQLQTPGRSPALA
jgi:hypothetical protein